MADPINRLAMYSMPVAPEPINHLAQATLPAGHPSNMLMWLRDQIPQVQADDSSTMSGITSRLGRTATAIPRAGLETMSNWLQGTHDPNAVRIGEDTIAPLGLFGMAGMAGRGVSAAAMADNAKSSVPGVVANALDMSQEARLTRAREQGFDTDTPWHHGTPDSRPIHEQGFVEREPGRGYFFARDSSVADTYQAKPAPLGSTRETIETRLKMENPLEIDWQRRPYRAKGRDKDGLYVEDHVKRAQELGHDGIIINNVLDTWGGQGKPSTISAVFDPSQIRSPQAAFDPANVGKSGLLLADNAKSSVPGTVVNAMGERRQIGDYDLVRQPGGTGDSLYYLVGRGQSPEASELGRFNVKPSQRDPSGFEVTNAFIDEPLRRQGLGTSVYDQIEADIAPARLMPSPSDQLSEHAKNFWAKRAPEKLEVDGPGAGVASGFESMRNRLADGGKRAVQLSAEMDASAARTRALLAKFAESDAKYGWGKVESSPSASAPGLAANSTQQDDNPVLGILSKYGLY